MYISTEIYTQQDNTIIDTYDGTTIDISSIATNVFDNLLWLDLFENVLLYIDTDLSHLIFYPKHKVMIKDILSYFYNDEFPLLYEEHSDTLLELISFAIDYYFSFIAIPRSSPQEERTVQYNTTNIINHLIEKDQHEQKSEEWHLYRHNLVTASNAWKILDSSCNVNNYIFNKCKPPEIHKQSSFNLSTPFHWGVKYEPLSVLLYEYLYETTISDFGCIQHDKHKFLGASPDGINTKPNNFLYGRMLEIKNIVNRDITGIPKKEYWVQMQLQMEVCNLDFCDFLECRFQEYTNSEDFFADGSSFTHTSYGVVKGCFQQFCIDDKPFYVYPPFQCSKQEYEIWENNMLNEHSDKTLIKTIYWYLDEYSCILVKRNKQWFESIVGQLESVWNIIQYERVNGYEHRESSNSKRKQNNVIFSIVDIEQ